MGEYKIVEFDKKDDLKAKYASATKALSLLGLKIKTAEPKPAKLTGELTKKQPAGFYLVADAKQAQLVLKHNKKVLDVAGTLDMALVEEIATLRAVEQATGVSYKKRIAALEADKKAPSKADPRAIKQAEADVALAAKVLDDLKKQHKALGEVTLDAVLKNPVLAGRFEKYADASGSADELEFVRAVQKGGKADAIYAKYIKADNGKLGPINFYNENNRDNKSDMVKDAYAITLGELRGEVMRKFKVEVCKPTEQRIAQAEKDLKHMKDARAKLDR